MKRIIVQRKNLDKKFKVAYIILAALLALILIVGIVQYVNYKIGQGKAVEIIKESEELMDEIECDKDDSDSTIAQSAYIYLTGEESHLDSTYDNPFRDEEGDSDYVDDYNEAADAKDSLKREMDVDLGELLEKKGYSSPFGTEISYFLEYTSFFDYISGTYVFDIIKMHLLMLIIIVLAAIIAVLNFLYKKNNKKNQYIIENDFLIHFDDNTEKEKYLISNTKSIELTKFSGIKMIGDGFVIKILFIDNREEIKNVLYDKMYGNNMNP